MDEKFFRDTRTQIGLLKSRGVIIKNKRNAKQIIRNSNYYNLINGYKEPFLQCKEPFEKYIPGTTLEEIFALYEFDRKLRIVTLEYILQIEKQVKSLIAYCFSKTHGHKNYLPLWVLVNSMSIGDISKFYLNMHQQEREEVSRRLKWGVREHHLSNALFFLSTIRNRCAHDERLYSYLSYARLRDNNYFKYFNVRSNTNNYFSVIVAFKMPLSKQKYIEYHDHIELLLDELSKSLFSIPISKIRNIMGIPNNWKRLKTLF